MKELTLLSVLTFAFVYGLNQSGFWEDVQKTAKTVHEYEYKALEFSKQLRLMQKENQKLRSKIARLEAEKEHLAMNSSGVKSLVQKREIASIPNSNPNDLVHFELYKWSADKLLGVGEQALHFKKFDKSAQYYNALIEHYPHSKMLDDKVFFEAGIAAYESGKHYDCAQNHFNIIVKNYPKSKYYRGAKLWLALSHFYQGNQKDFIETVDEFRKKYRNTKEWKVLSKYYEELNYKYKQ